MTCIPFFRVPSPRIDQSSGTRVNTARPSVKPGLRFLDIGTDELDDLMAGRGLAQVRLTRAPPCGGLENNPMLLVGQIAQSVINDAIVKVCDELLSVDVINNLIEVELK